MDLRVLPSSVHRLSEKMEHQAILVTGESVEENETAEAGEIRGMKWMLYGASSSMPQDERKENGEERHWQDEAYQTNKARLDYSLPLIEHRLGELQSRVRGEGRISSICIFPLPRTIPMIKQRAQVPELVSIGPYYRGTAPLIDFEEYKWFFLDKFLSRGRALGRSLQLYLNMMMELEGRARDCYSNLAPMLSHDFVEMMLLDGCFVVELLRHLGESGDSTDEGDPIFTRPWLIPPLIRDLLKLENQLPFFILDSLFRWSSGAEETKALPLLALKVFDLALPRSPEATLRFQVMDVKHLLHLFYLSLLPPKRAMMTDPHQPAHQPMQCVTRLRPSGIKFKSSNADSFLDIKYKNWVLQIPSITINDFTSTVLINCVAWEQCLEEGSNYFTDYISFMNCLINQPRDVAFLCSDGIISGFSQDDQYVTKLFKQLGKISGFKVRDCYLSEEVREIEAYYSSNWATMKRTYFSTPWSFISVFYAFILILLTIVQTIMSVWSYRRQFG